MLTAVIIIGILLAAAMVWAVSSKHDDGPRLTTRSDAQSRIDRYRGP